MGLYLSYRLVYYFQKDNGGVVMLNFYPNFVACGEKANLSQVAGMYYVVNR